MDAAKVVFTNSVGEDRLVVRVAPKDKEPGYGLADREAYEFFYAGAWDALTIRTVGPKDRSYASVYNIEVQLLDYPSDRHIEKVHAKLVELLNEFVLGRHTEMVRNIKL